MGGYWQGWMTEREFEKFERLCPWPIEIHSRWTHVDPPYRGELAFGLEIYADEGAEAIAAFFDYFNDLLDGEPAARVRRREAKWKRLMAAAISPTKPGGRPAPPGSRSQGGRKWNFQ